MSYNLFFNQHTTLYKKIHSLEMINTKVVNLLFKGKTDFVDTTDIKVGKIKNKDVIVSMRAYVAFDKSMLPTNLTAYDREVLNGVCSIYSSGETIMTNAMIYKAFAGKGTKNPKTLKHVNSNINKLRSTVISIDWTEHAKMNGLSLSDKDYTKTHNNILLMNNISANINSTETIAFQLLSPPSLYSYAKAIGQSITVDKELLYIYISNTKNSIIIKNYILRRIEAMKKKSEIKLKAMLYFLKHYFPKTIYQEIKLN